MSGATPPAMPDLKAADPMDLGQVGVGLLTFICGLLPFYKASFEGFGVKVSDTVNAYHGFFGWFGVWLALAAAVVLAVALIGITLPFPVRMTVLGLFGAAVVCFLLAFFIIPGGGDAEGLGIDTGHGFGYWLGFLAVIAGTVLAFLKLNAPVTALPSASKPASPEPPAAPPAPPTA